MRGFRNHHPSENLTTSKEFGVEFTYFFALYDWWKLNGDLNFFHSFSEGTYQYEGREVYVGGKSFSLTSKTISRFTFWEKFNSQMVLSYAAPRTTTQGVNRAMVALDLAGSVDLLKNNGTVTLSVSDVFNSRRRRSYSEDATFYSADNFLWQSRSVILSFHYRINQHKKQNQIYSSPIKDDDLERF
ncbi:MAG: outer membrane beta-barrel protein [Saprospiraceae bacterium]